MAGFIKGVRPGSTIPGDEAAVFAALGNGTVSVLDLSRGWIENEVAGGRNISLTLNKGGG